MKKILLGILLPLVLCGNLTFAETRTYLYKGNSEMGLKYYAVVWRADDPYQCNGFNAGIYTIFTLGIGPAISCLRTGQRNAIINARLNVTLNEVENGRASIVISVDPAKGCAGFSNTLFAEENGFGGYSLFSSKEDWVNGNSIGSALKNESNLQLNFEKQNGNINTPGKDGHTCVWQLGENFNATLELK